MPKIDLITGFLGSGKTTFLLKYAKYLMQQGQRLGILEYDYGAVNTDMLLLSELRGDRCELEMLAAACDEDCLRRRFRTKLISMAMCGYDRVILEPSGIFDMDLFFDTLRDAPLEDMYEMGNIIAVADPGMPVDLTQEEAFVLASQISCAGITLFSRAQQFSADAILRAQQKIEQAAQTIQCRHFSPVFLSVDWDTLSDSDFTGIASCGYRIPNYVKTIAGQPLSFSSVCFLDIRDSLSDLRQKASALFSDPAYGNVFRIKGFVENHGVFYQLNATRQEITSAPIPSAQRAVIIIGRNLCESRIRTLMQA